MSMLTVRRVVRIRAATLALCLGALSLTAIPGAASAAQLVGDSTISSVADTDGAGLAEAFLSTASTAGSLGELHVYLDGTSRATKVTIGVYSDNAGHPGTLLAQGSTSSPATGWNTIAVTPVSISAGVKYWLALLGTGGTIAFRDHCCGAGSAAENNAGSALTSLPSTWSSGARWSDGSASLYGATTGETPPPPPPPPSELGQWSPLMNWGIVAAHSILLHTGKLIEMDGWIAPNPTKLFDPTTGTLTTITNPFGLDIFCSGNASLSDGRVVIAGGHGFAGEIGINNTTIFDPVNNAWTAGPSMNYARWYPTVTELGDGRLVAISGNIGTNTVGRYARDLRSLDEPVDHAQRYLHAAGP